MIDEFWMTLRGHDPTSPLAWVGECSRLIEERSVTVVAVTMLTYFRSLAHELVVELTARYPQVRFVAGGPHAAFRPERIMRFTPSIDAVFKGEADAVVGEIIDAVGAGSRAPAGLVRRGARPLELDYQITERSLFEMPSYGHYAEPVEPNRVVMMTSRGCPTPFCTFCGITAGGGEFRVQNLEAQRTDLRRAVELGVEAVEFHDSIFTLRSERVDTLFDDIDLGGISEFYCHTRPNDITPRVIDSLARTGARWRVFVGLETADVNVRRGARKSALGVESFVKNMKVAADAGVDIGVFLIFGLPGESLNSIRATYELLDRCPPAEVFASPLKYIPGSALHRRAVEAGVLGVDDLIDPAGPPGIHIPQGEALLDALAAVEVFTSRFDRSREHNRVEQSYTLRFEEPGRFHERVDDLRARIGVASSA